MEVNIDINNSVMYKLTGKYMAGTDLIGLEVLDNKGTKKLIKIADVHELIQKGLIYGCTLIESGDIIHIRSEHQKIADLPLVSKDGKKNRRKYTAVARLFRDRKLVGYKIIDEDSKTFNVSKEKLWSMAKDTEINNVKASINNNIKILRGVGRKLLDLPTLNM